MNSRQKERRKKTLRMHRAWFINEILISVLEFLFFASPRAVADSARACRLFRDASLDILWYEQGTLEYLFRVFPFQKSCGRIKKGRRSHLRDISKK